MEDESEFTDPYVPKFLNQEPVVLMGLTEIELFASLGVGFLVGGLSTGTLSAMLGAGIFSLIVFVFGWGLVSFLFMNFLSTEKVGKPRGFVKAKIKIMCKRFNPTFSLYVEDEPLTIGRSKRPLIYKDGEYGE